MARGLLHLRPMRRRLVPAVLIVLCLTAAAAAGKRPGVIDRIAASKTMRVVNGINLIGAIGQATAAVVTRSPELAYGAASNFVVWRAGVKMHSDAVKEAKVWGRATPPSSPVPPRSAGR